MNLDVLFNRPQLFALLFEVLLICSSFALALFNLALKLDNLLIDLAILHLTVLLTHLKVFNLLTCCLHLELESGYLLLETPDLLLQFLAAFAFLHLLQLLIMLSFRLG